MTRLGPDFDKWLPELQTVLAAAARALRGRAPNPSLLLALLPEYKGCIAGSEVALEYFPDGYTAGPAQEPEYVVALRGPFSPSWLLRERDLYHFIASQMTGS